MPGHLVPSTKQWRRTSPAAAMVDTRTSITALTMATHRRAGAAYSPGGRMTAAATFRGFALERCYRLRHQPGAPQVHDQADGCPPHAPAAPRHDLVAGAAGQQRAAMGRLDAPRMALDQRHLQQALHLRRRAGRCRLPHVGGRCGAPKDPVLMRCSNSGCRRVFSRVTSNRCDRRQGHGVHQRT